MNLFLVKAATDSVAHLDEYATYGVQYPTALVQDAFAEGGTLGEVATRIALRMHRDKWGSDDIAAVLDAVINFAAGCAAETGVRHG